MPDLDSTDERNDEEDMAPKIANLRSVCGTVDPNRYRNDTYPTAWNGPQR